MLISSQTFYLMQALCRMCCMVRIGHYGVVSAAWLPDAIMPTLKTYQRLALPGIDV